MIVVDHKEAISSPKRRSVVSSTLDQCTRAFSGQFHISLKKDGA